METWGELSRRAGQMLAAGGIESARYDARELAAFVGGISRSELLTRLPEPCGFGSAELDRFWNLIGRRICGEPLQYLLESWDFYGRAFDVGPGVLIPRQDTETLVEETLTVTGALPSPLAYDLCAGSGCIGITLGLECPALRMTELEWSNAALYYLKSNVRRMAPGIAVCKADVLSAETLDTLPRGGLVVSNPPYIRSCDLGGLSREVKREPAVALDGGEDGLRFYRAIAANAPLLPDGWLVLEIGSEQADEVTALLRENGYGDVRLRRDWNGLPRVVSGRRI